MISTSLAPQELSEHFWGARQEGFLPHQAHTGWRGCIYWLLLVSNRGHLPHFLSEDETVTGEGGWASCPNTVWTELRAFPEGAGGGPV